MSADAVSSSASIKRRALAWRIAKYVLGLALAGLAIWAVTGKTDELSGASHYLDHIRWPWLALALGAEIGSYLAFAGMQRRLLKAGDVSIPLGPMAGITLAGNAIQTTLPAGIVLSAAFAFRQYRRYGADEVLAGWTLVAMTFLSVATLAGVAAVGLMLALGSGSALDLVGAIVGVVVVMALIVVAWIYRQAWLPWAASVVRLSQRVVHRPRGDADVLVQSWIDRVGMVSPNKRAWAAASLMALANWVTDGGCLVFCFLAVGAGVPWRGLLLAYGAAQLATNLPITPGGLGVVEGSLTVALVAFGGAEASTVAAVLLYRVLSFWLMLPAGWSSWGAMSVLARRQLRRETAALDAAARFLAPVAVTPATVKDL